MGFVESQLAPVAAFSGGLEVRLLGPVSLAFGGRDVPIRSPKQRVILAMLALSPRVTVDAIADALWRDTPPASVAATVHTLVSRLRRTLQEAGGGITIRSEGAGYVMEVDPERVDVNRFEAAVAAGRRCLAEGSTADGARWLREALSLWRGPALDDVSDRDFARVAATRLDEGRLRVAEELAEAELAGGAPAAALEMLEPLLARYPFHERLRGQQMLALYRLGRQADALAAFQDLRHCLAEELGLDPTPALVALERQILLQDPELDRAPGAPQAGPSGPEDTARRDDAALAGTLVFLFTDIESSTSRWESDQAAMAADLACHDELLGNAIAAHGGRRFTHTGDGLGAAFPTAGSAIAAAVAGQAALAEAHWRATAPLRVRMAIHAGAAEARAGTFLGPTLNRTARLLDVARGGEILCSQAAADLAHDDLPPEVTLAGRGERRLRGLSRPETVWQIVHPALAPVGPPPEPPAPAIVSPEASLTSFVGRERELAELSALLGEARLVTITGVGGAGKTRLALELADQRGPSFTDGATVVELAPVGGDRPLAGVVLTTLGVDAGGPSAEAADQRLDEALAERHLLLVLDNCEHLLVSVTKLVDRVVRHCPGVTVLATSREVLSVPGEVAWVAPGLSLPAERPADPGELDGSDAAALFIARARVAQPGFGVTPTNVAAVASICRRLDGLPLALELAAARVRVLGAAQVAAHLDDRFRLLTCGDSVTARHQTLGTCLDWSYDALPEAEQRLLQRLSVFPQHFDLDAAAAVAGAEDDVLGVLDLLARLVDKSLVVPDGAAETARYHLLETVRQYGAAKLAAAGDEGDAAVRHRRYFVGLVEEWHRRGEMFMANEWMDRAAADRENFHTALVNALRAADTESVSVLIAGLWMPWYLTGSVPPAVSSIDPAALGCANPSLHVDALIGFNVVPKMSTSELSLDDLTPLLDRAVEVADQRGERRDQAWARCMLAYVTRSRGDVGKARSLMEEALARYEEDRSAFGLTYVHYELGWVAMTAGDEAGAGRHFRAALAFSEGLTGYDVLIPATWSALALADAAEGRTSAALAGARRAIESARPLSLSAYLVMALLRAAQAAAVAGQPAPAELAEMLHLVRRQGGRHWVSEALTVAALFHEAEGRHDLAARLLGGATAVAEALGENPEPIPVVGTLVQAARHRLATALGVEFAEQESVGHHMSATALLRAAADAV
jgi:predicted ATPase/DNA-binding SARP family transcriptional activator